MQRHTRAVSSEILEIPASLFQALEVTEDFEALDGERALSLLQLVEHRSQSEVPSILLLKAAKFFAQQQDADKAVLCLGMCAEVEAISLTSKGKPAAAIGLLVDVLNLAHDLLASSRPEATRKLAQLLANLTEEAITLCSQIDFPDIDTAADDIARVLNVVSTVWDPELEIEFRQLEGMVPSLSELARHVSSARQQRIRAEGLIRDLIAVREGISAKRLHRHRVHKRVLLTERLIEAWIQMVQRILLAENNVDGSNADRSGQKTLIQEVQDLIREVEQRLRALIAQKYHRQFGPGWLQHIEAKHKEMYAYWLRNMGRDQSAFGVYPQYSLEILEYARFEDLSELITAQWNLFREVFDFGYENRNKAVFYDKMFQIAQVRNPLAHHRSIPKNELLRGRVLCTDILLALDRTTKDVTM